MSDVPFPKSSSIGLRIPDGEPIIGRIVPVSPSFLVPGDLSLLPTTVAQVRWWPSEHQLAEVPNSEEPPEIPDDGNLDVYAGDVKGKRNMELFDLAGRPNLGHRSCIGVNDELL